MTVTAMAMGINPWHGTEEFRARLRIALPRDEWGSRILETIHLRRLGNQHSLAEWARIFSENDIEMQVEMAKYANQASESQSVTGARTTYITPWLTVVQEAIDKFFNPRRDTDAKAEEVVNWVRQRAQAKDLGNSKKIAEAVFTIIKPTDHNPKARRDKKQG
jgi:hypothetical protein